MALEPSVPPRTEDEVIYAEVERIKRAGRPKAVTVLATVLAGVLVVLIGGLASYYYYSVASQSGANAKSVEEQWESVVEATENLTTAFGKVEVLADITAETDGSFAKVVDETNRTLRDVIYTLQGQPAGGYSLTGNIFNGRLNTFLDDYIAYLRELQRLIEKGRGDLIATDGLESVKPLKELSDKMNESYDNLLVADKDKIIATPLSRELFAMAGEIEDLVQVYLDDKTKQDELTDAEKQSANDVATKFMQSYRDKDTVAMKLYLTPAAAAELNAGAIQEETAEIVSYKITDTRSLAEAKIEIDAELTRHTPDENEVTERRLFVMLKQSNGWLIDSWKVR